MKNKNFFSCACKNILLVSGSTLVFGCASFGPKANITLVQSEITVTKSVGTIIIPETIGVVDPQGLIDKAIAGVAVSAYGKRSRPVVPVKMALKTAGMGGVADILMAPWQAEFAKVIETYKTEQAEKKDQAIRPENMTLPKSDLEGVKFPSDFTKTDQLKEFASGLKKYQDDLQALAKTAASGDTKALVSALGSSKVAAPLLVKLDQVLFEQFKADYILLTYVDGDEATFKAKKPIAFYAALVNIKTGKFRYFADASAAVGSIPIPYNIHLTTMANSVLNGASDADALPTIEKVASKTTSKKLKSSGKNN